MADDRPVDDPIAAIGDLRKMVADLRTTLMARVSRRPTGSIEGVLLPAAPPDTLLLNGQTVAQASYPALWKWVSDNGLVALGAFSSSGGNFTLPDFRARALRGVAAGGNPGQLVGSDTINLTTGQLPGHNHTFGTNSAGSHGGHLPAQAAFITPAGSTYGLTAWNDSGSSNGSHSHSGTTDNTGSGNGVDVRQASIGVTFVIYT